MGSFVAFSLLGKRKNKAQAIAWWKANIDPLGEVCPDPRVARRSFQPLTFRMIPTAIRLVRRQARERVARPC